MPIRLNEIMLKVLDVTRRGGQFNINCAFLFRIDKETITPSFKISTTNESREDISYLAKFNSDSI